MTPDELDQLPECTPDDVEIALHWDRKPDGELVGRIEVRNASSHPCKISNKPNIQPLGMDGEPLPTHTVVSAELRTPPFAALAPGARAHAQVGWAGWDGESTSGQVIIAWPGGRQRLTATGPHQPARSGPGGATNLYSSWFSLVPE